jgi:3-oxoacyl-[acyl-carrier protein] reductase
MDLGLAGARVLVTAASQGLGAATAEAFSAEGAQVVINSRNADTLQATADRIQAVTGHTVHALAADVADNAAAAAMVEAAVGMLGGLDILVTNAGGPPAGGFDAFDQGQWESAVQLTFLSAVNLIRCALPHLRQSERAAVLTVTSISAKQPINNLTLSNSIRPAVVGLTKTLADEIGPAGVRVNSILPGVTDTERVVSLMQSRAEQNDTDPDTEYERAAQANPVRRIGNPTEFAKVAVFLCSPAASFVTGVAIPVDGGASRSIL